MPRRYALSPPTASRLETLLGQGAQWPEQRDGRAGTLGRRPILVRCTSATPEGGGGTGDDCYPAVVVDVNSTPTAVEELGRVWLTVLGSGATLEVPTADAMYLGVLSGEFDPGSDLRPRVFALVGVDADTSIASGGPFWQKVATVTYSQLAVASPTNDIEVYSLPARQAIHGGVLKHSTQFSGGSIVSYNLSVGVTLAGQIVRSLNAGTAPSDTNFVPNGGPDTPANPQPYNFGAATSIRLQADSTPANLNDATQGSVDVWLCLATLPA